MLQWIAIMILLLLLVTLLSKNGYMAPLEEVEICYAPNGDDIANEEDIIDELLKEGLLNNSKNAAAINDTFNTLKICVQMAYFIYS